MRYVRSSLRLFTAALLTLIGCMQDPLSGPGGSRMRPPYLAVVVFVDAPAEVTSRGPYSFRVREYSGTLAIDTTVRATPKDTLIFPVEPATYRVDIADVPPTCGVREGTAQVIVVPPNTNTSLVRFFINCEPALVVAAYTDGANPDSAYILGITKPDGTEQASLIAANDTVRLDGLPAGNYSVTLRHVASHCVIISNGGERVSVTISKAGGAFIAFRIVCAEVQRRPRIVSFAASYANGSIGYIIRAVDPDRDVERTFVDITDCNRRSVLPAGGLRRGGFSGFPNVTQRDTAVVFGGYDLPLNDATLRGKCIAAWVADERGNTSEFVEQPLVARDASRSPTGTFNARLNGTRGLQVALSAADPNGDFAGTFLVYLLRDGVVSLPADGLPDRLVSHPPGLIGFTIPELPLGIGFGEWSDYTGAIVYLVDRAGNFTRLEDVDLFR